MTSLTTPTTKN